MKKVYPVLIAFISVFIFSCGKVAEITEKPPTTLEPKTEKKGLYTYVVPANFIFEEEKSLIYEKGKDVRAYVVYTGKARLKDLVEFFDEYLYKLGWEKESKLVGEEAILAYSRNEQLIVIKIEPKFATTHIKMLLTKD
ncbi:MAG: hypothetical protein GXO22_02560 [Aquificae bacterium]|nr:hypothetical protein [Aquificota bacterium]